MNVTAIILAAGASRRMETQKLLLPFGGKTVIEHVIDRVKAAGITDVVAVVGADHAVAEMAHRCNVRVVVNANPDDGMLSSVRCGLRAVPDTADDAVIVILGDQPSISPVLLRAMVAAWEASPRRILVPTFQGRRGHPLMFSLDYRDEVLTRYDEGGLRELLRHHEGDVLDMPADASVLADMDDLADYRRELKRHADGGL